MNANDWLSLVIVVICLLLSAFFAGSETALTASSRASMARLEKHGNKRAGIVNRLLEQRERLLGALLFGNNAVNIAASVLATGILLDLVRPRRRALCHGGDDHHRRRVLRDPAEDGGVQRARPHRACGGAADVLVRQLFGPVLMAIEALVRWLLKHVGMTVGEDQQVLSAREELRGAVDLLHREGDVETLDRDMFGGVLDLRDLVGLRRDDPPHRHDHARRRRSSRKTWSTP